MKKILCMMSIIIALMFTLSGCAKCIDIRTTTVQVKVVDSYHRPMYITHVHAGKTTTMITHPAIYRISVEYDGVEYEISGMDIYDNYSDRIGEYTNGTLETRKYDDGTERYDIIDLE